jgi:branched-chain amino acid transport system substrate-binding protein
MKSLGLTLVATVAALAALSGCGSSPNSSSPPSSSQGNSTSTTTAAGPAIQIGFANEDTGSVATFPGLLASAETAVKYLNSNAGGLDGRRIDLVSCDMKNTVQGAQECGQQFASDTAMPFVILGITLNGGPFYSALNAVHKPVLGTIAVDPADDSASNAYFYYQGAIGLSMADYAKTTPGIHSVASMYDDQAAGIATEGIMAAALKPRGISIKGTAIPAAASDVTPLVADSGASTADLLMINSGTGCSQVGPALQSLGIKPKQVLVNIGCLPTSLLAKSGSLFQGWLADSYYTLSLPSTASNPAVALFQQSYQRYGPGGNTPPYGELGWGIVMTAAKMFDGAKDITSASASTTMQSFKGPVVLGDNAISCPGSAPYQSTCGTGTFLYQVSDGNLVPYH